MHARCTAMLLLMMIAVAPKLIAGGKADNKASLTFHLETDATDNPKMIVAQMTNGKIRYYRRMAEITTQDVAAFNPFPADGGGDDYGIVFQLKDHAAKRYAAITNANQGRWLIAQMNGRVVDAVQIDKGINDGLVVVWKGATLADIKVFDHSLPRFGQDGKNPKK